MSETDQRTLHQKLHEIAEAIGSIAKSGRNEHHKYDYVEAAEVTRKIREELLKRNIIVLPSAAGVEHFTETGGKSFVTTVALSYRFIDCDSGSEESIEWVGAGSDVGGDKGLYKAYTGGLKYALLNTFLISTGDDPERDDTSEAPGQEHKDDARPAAPEIPLDRAKAILEQAVAAELAKKEGTGATLKPVFKAKLAAVGVNTGKIAHLNVDQAEDVEAWIAAEASNGDS